MKIKASDYIINLLVEYNIKEVFGLTGGAVVHLFDSVEKNPNINPVYTHHEQSASFAAEAYAKYKNDLGVAFFTTGPGGTNGITGLAGAWLDSIPVLYISGQARLAHTTQGKQIRQLGTQQLDIIPVVKPLTKYAVMIEDINEIKYHIQKAIYTAKSGRPGPVWLDIPLDFQWTLIDPKEQKEFIAPKEEKKTISNELINIVKKKLLLAKRPLILLGYGAKIANKENKVIDFIRKLNIPVVSTWNACDLLPHDDSQNIGILGIAGHRGANFAVHNSDLVIAMGSHFPMPVTGGDFSNFAPDAFKIVINIDKEELENETVKIDLKINSDLSDFISSYSMEQYNVNEKWLDYCKKYKLLNNEKEHYKKATQYGVDQYLFTKKISELLPENSDYVIDGGGTNVYISHQSLELKKDQKLVLSHGLCSMGSGLPEAIGVCFASNRQNTLCFCGDGSFQLNIQELQTIKHHNLPIKIFVFNNSGYLSIRQTQEAFLESNFTGSEAKGGMSLPNYMKVVEAYGIKTYKIESLNNVDETLKTIINEKTPTFCEVMIHPEQDVIPRQGFKEQDDGTFVAKLLYDMYPYLEEKKIQELMVNKDEF